MARRGGPSRVYPHRPPSAARSSSRSIPQVSFAGGGYRVGNRYVGQIVGVRVVEDTVQITQDASLLRTHRARHDKTKEFGALATPGGRPRRGRSGCRVATGPTVGRGY